MKLNQLKKTLNILEIDISYEKHYYNYKYYSGAWLHSRYINSAAYAILNIGD
jgi:hypothetical protein